MKIEFVVINNEGFTTVALHLPKQQKVFYLLLRNRRLLVIFFYFTKNLLFTATKDGIRCTNWAFYGFHVGFVPIKLLIIREILSIKVFYLLTIRELHIKFVNLKFLGILLLNNITWIVALLINIVISFIFVPTVILFRREQWIVLLRKRQAFETLETFIGLEWSLGAIFFKNLDFFVFGRLIPGTITRKIASK